MSDFRKNLITLVSGAGMVQAIPILLTPLLTRLYAPADFGLLATFSAFISVLGVVVCGRYELTAMHAKNKIELANLLTISLIVTCLSSIVVVAVTFLYARQIAGLLGKTSLEPWLLWSVFPIFSTGMMQVYAIYLAREKRYKDLVKGRVIQSFSAGLVGVFMGLSKTGPAGLLTGYTVGLVVAVIYFFKKMRWALTGVSFRRMGLLAIRHKQYPVFSAPAALLDTATQSIVVFLLSKFYLGDVLGYFSQAHRLLIIPLALIGTSVAQAFFQHASEQRRKHQPLLPLLKQTSRKLLLYSAPCFLIFIVFAPWAFELVLGKGWSVAGEYGQLVALAYWVRLGVSPVSSVFLVVERVRLGAVWQLIYFCTSVSVLAFSAWTRMPIVSFFIVYALHEGVLYGLYYSLAYYACKKDDLKRFA